MKVKVRVGMFFSENMSLNYRNTMLIHFQALSKIGSAFII